MSWQALKNVVEFRGELKQAELAPSDFLFSGHVCLRFGFWWYKTLYQNDMAAVCFTGLPLSGDYHLCKYRALIFASGSASLDRVGNKIRAIVVARRKSKFKGEWTFSPSGDCSSERCHSFLSNFRISPMWLEVWKSR